eukprot:5293660-Amphidinium_carterae.1
MFVLRPGGFVNSPICPAPKRIVIAAPHRRPCTREHSKGETSPCHKVDRCLFHLPTGAQTKHHLFNQLPELRPDMGGNAVQQSDP